MVALSTVAASAQIIGTLTSFFSRSYNPTNELILSIGSMVEATNLKIDAIYESIELLHDEMRLIRTDIQETPLRTVSLSETYRIRGIIDEAEDILNGKDQFFDNPELFYQRVFDISERLRAAIYTFTNISADRNHDSFVNVALANDAYYRLSLTLLRQDAFEAGVDFSVGDLLAVLQHFESYLSDALGDEKEGIENLLQTLRDDVADATIPSTIAYYKNSSNGRGIHIGDLFGSSSKPHVRFTSHSYPIIACHEYDRQGITCLDPEFGPRITNVSYTRIAANVVRQDMSDYEDYEQTSHPFINEYEISKPSREEVEQNRPKTVVEERKRGSLADFIETVADQYDLVLSQYYKTVFVHSSMKDLLKITKERRKRFSGVFS